MVLSRMKLLNLLALSVLHYERFEWLNLRLDSNDSLCEFLILVVKFFSFELFPVVMKTAYKLLILVLVSNSARQQSLSPFLLFLKIRLFFSSLTVWMSYKRKKISSLRYVI